MRREKVNAAAEFAKERGGAQHKEVLNLVVIGRALRFRIRSGIYSRIRAPIPEPPLSIFSTVGMNDQLNENGQVFCLRIRYVIKSSGLFDENLVAKIC
jgi:hypothetical protein